MRKLLLSVAAAAALHAAQPAWLESVAPVVTPAQKKLYLSLKPEARERFEDEFWADKSIAPAEYFKRIQYIDSQFGSGKLGSGANTDQGRVYLALGPPTKITHIPSSRIFFPLEIWYYDVVPGVLNTELRLIFFQKNNVGFMHLYSPTTDTIRALLIPQAAVQDTFGPNDDYTEADIRNMITVPPGEDEVVSAAVNVATGIRYEGNDEILGKITSPSLMLSKSLTASVKSRLIVNHPKLDILETVSPFGGSQIDLGLDTAVQRELDLQIAQGPLTVYQNQLHLKFPDKKPVRYTHRLDLLPGSYRVLFTVDGTVHPYSLEVKEQTGMSNIYRAEPAGDVERRQTPFEFDGKQVDLDPNGKFAVVAVSQPGKVNWTIRRGVMDVLWKSTTDAREMAMVELPTTGIPPGTYKLEAKSDTDTKLTDFIVAEEKKPPSDATLLSFNANLAPAVRLASVGHQWLLRGKLDQAMHSLQASLERGATREAGIEMARVDALAGRYDAARDRLKPILAARPDDFDAISVLAFVEAQLQDYRVAAELYRRALAIQDSPDIRMALAKLPQP